MPKIVLRTMGSARLALRRPHVTNFIGQYEIWMAILMIYLPPLYFYRNNGSILITLCATCFCFAFISLPVFLVELLISAFSNGSLIRAYDFNRLARVIPCWMLLLQFQVILAGMSNGHKILTFSLTYFLQNMNPNFSPWSCNNPWNTDECCLLEKLSVHRNSCSTPLEEFYKHYGNILLNGLYVPGSSTYDGGMAHLAMWILLAAFIILIAQLSLRNGIRLVTYLITIPSLVLLCVQVLHCYMQPLTMEKISDFIMRRDNFKDEYIFTFFVPNIYHANHMMVAGGYLVVLHCCRKPHRKDSQLKKLIFNNLMLLAFCLVALKTTVCILRLGTVGASKFMRKQIAGTPERENFRDLFEDSSDWLYQYVFETIEAGKSMQVHYNYVSPLMILETASALNSILMALGFIGIRIALYKATWELIFQSVGFSELMFGPWQMLTRVAMPLCILALNFVLDSDITRDLLFPKEPYGFALSTLNAALFLLSILVAHVCQKIDSFGQSLHWRMMEFGLRFKRRIILVGILAGVHSFGAWVYKNIFTNAFRFVIKGKRPHSQRLEYFFEYKVGVFASPASRVFSFSGSDVNWLLHDMFLYIIGFLSIIFGLLQSGRVLRFLLNNYNTLNVISWKPMRCFKYCIEFYLAVIFGNRSR